MNKKDTSLKKLPPHDDAAEKSVLGSIMLESDYLLKIMEIIDSGDFYQPAHQKIFKTMKSMDVRGIPLTLLTLSESLLSFGSLEIIGGPPYLMDLLEATPTATTAIHHAKIIKKKAMLRKIIEISTQLEIEAYGEQVEVETLLNITDKVFDDIRSDIGKGIKDWEKLGDTLPDVFEEIEAICEPVDDNKKNTSYIIPTGFDVLDKMIVGLPESDMVVLAGRPGMGKTAFSFSVAGNIAKAGIPVAIFSIETARKQAAMRILCTEAKVDSHYIRDGSLGQSDWENLSNGFSVLNNIPLYILDCPGLTLQEFRHKTKKIIDEKGVRFIVVDYLQLMHNKDVRGGRTEEISSISRGIKAVARKFNIPIMPLSQLSRVVEKRKPPRPILSDLRESGAIEQDADMVIFLYRSAYYTKKVLEGGGEDLSTDIIIAKNRNGRNGTAKMIFIPKYTRFEEMNLEGY